MTAGPALVACALLLGGCTTAAGDRLAAPHEGRPDGSLSDLPPRARVASLPLLEQHDSGACGPTAMAMVLAWAGAPVPVDRLAAQMLTPALDGTLQADMLTVARRHGYAPRELAGLPPLLREVAAGRPVVVLENLRWSWWPQWHYAVVAGYDLARGELRLHTGAAAAETVTVATFLGRWRDAREWGLVLEKRAGLATGP